MFLRIGAGEVRPQWCLSPTLGVMVIAGYLLCGVTAGVKMCNKSTEERQDPVKFSFSLWPMIRDAKWTQCHFHFEKQLICWEELLSLLQLRLVFLLSYISDLVIPSTWHFLGSHSVGTSQASANSHRFHSLIWCIHKGIHSTWEASDIAIGCERRWEDGWRGWWTQGLTGASRGRNRAWCNSTSTSLFCHLGHWFLQYVAWNANDLTARSFLEPSNGPLTLWQCSVASCDTLQRAALCSLGYVWPGVARRLVSCQ